MNGSIKERCGLLDVHCDEPDIELVVRARNEPEAFSELIRRHYQGCFRTAMSILRNTADAEDAVQNGVLNAFIHIADFQHRANFRTWLISIVVNECLTIIRKRRRGRHISIEQDCTTPRQSAELRSSANTPEEFHHANELAESVFSNVGRLPSLFRNVLMMQAVEGLETAKVAERLGISREAVKSRAHRARLELRRRLEPHVCTPYSVSLTSISRPL